MAVRMKRPGKRVLALLGILAVFAAGCIGFTGCRGGSGDTVSYTHLTLPTN